MHPNALYRGEDRAQALSLAAARGFGVVTARLDALMGAHVPFVLADLETLHLHLHRGNPLAKAATPSPIEVMVVVSLCDAYVSPDWYGMGPDQVPTWLYGAVHIHGQLRALPDAQLEPMLADLSARFESPLDKTPWTLDKMAEKPKRAMMRAIQPFDITIHAVEMTHKFAQNKPPEARAQLATHIQGSFGANLSRVHAAITAQNQNDSEDEGQSAA